MKFNEFKTLINLVCVFVCIQTARWRAQAVKTNGAIGVLLMMNVLTGGRLLYLQTAHELIITLCEFYI